MADTLDILTEAEALEAIHKGTPAPSDLDLMVTLVSRVIDATCGPVVVRTVTAELHDGGASSIHLRRWPVTSVTAVREIQAPGTIDTLSAVAWGAATSGYSALAWERDPSLKSGRLLRKMSGLDSVWTPGEQTVEVTYQAGRYADTASVDERFKAGASAVLRRLWKRESATWAQAPAFLEQVDREPTQGFYRAVRPIVEELLGDEVQLGDAGLA
jgi:hypothetical protein